MEDYAREMRRLQPLWDEMQDEDVIESDGESDINSVSVSSDYPDVEQACGIEDGQGNLLEVIGATANTEDTSVIENESRYMQERTKCYLSKNDSTRVT
ncbi:hypothetical protein Trydic_g13824 [Trypoxylus dichotomus]